MTKQPHLVGQEVTNTHERTNSWMNGYGKLRRMTDRNGTIVDFYLYLAAGLVTIRQLIQRARNRYRWDTRPTVKRLK